MSIRWFWSMVFSVSIQRALGRPPEGGRSGRVCACFRCGKSNQHGAGLDESLRAWLEALGGRLGYAPRFGVAAGRGGGARVAVRIIDAPPSTPQRVEPADQG